MDCPLSPDQFNADTNDATFRRDFVRAMYFTGNYAYVGWNLRRSMFQDKKVRQGRLTFILARGIGEAFVEREADLWVVRGVLGDALSARGT